MRRLRIALVCGATVLAVAGITAPAFAAAPEMGRCLKVEAVKEGTKTVYHGGYTNSGCTTVSAPKTGKYEWYPGPGTKTHFKGEGTTVATLETVGKAIVKCTGNSGKEIESSEGEITGPKTAANIKVIFRGCESAGDKCDTTGAAVGEIRVNTLSATVEWENKAKKKAALDLAPQTGTMLVEFECGHVLEAKVRGSVLVPIKTDKMETKVTEKFSASKGKQKPEDYETASGEKVRDVLETKLAELGGGAFEQSGQTITNVQTDEEALEVNAVV